MKLSWSAARVAGMVLLFATVCATGMIGCSSGVSDVKPASEEETKKVNDEMRKSVEKANKAKANK